MVNRDNAAVHVSGHCNEGELLYMYNIVKPKCAMPIHGENRHLVANGMIAVKTGVDPQNVVLAEDGDVVDLYHGQAAVVGSVPCGYVYVDGDSVGELTDEELEKRRILGTEGFVSASWSSTPNRGCHHRPEDLPQRGRRRRKRVRQGPSPDRRTAAGRR